jgi:hypothetical protein
MAAMTDVNVARHRLDDAGNFKINGWTPFHGAEPVDFFEQAHGLATFVTAVAANLDGIDKATVSPGILIEVFRSIETLIGLGLLVDRNKQASA